MYALELDKEKDMMLLLGLIWGVVLGIILPKGTAFVTWQYWVGLIVPIIFMCIAYVRDRE